MYVHICYSHPGIRGPLAETPATQYYDTTTGYDTIPIWKRECTGGNGRDGWRGERVERFFYHSFIYLFSKGGVEDVGC